MFEDVSPCLLHLNSWMWVKVFDLNLTIDQSTNLYCRFSQILCTSVTV